MADKAWYVIQQESPNRWKVTKFKNLNFEPAETYQVSQPMGHSIMLCSCYAGNKETCRHRKMIPIFQAQVAIGTGWMYQYDTGKWQEPQEDPT